MNAVKIQRSTAKTAIAACRLPPGQLIEATMQTDKLYIEGLQKLDKGLPPAFIIQDVFNTQIVSSPRISSWRGMKTSERPLSQIRPLKILSRNTRYRQHPSLPKVVNRQMPKRIFDGVLQRSGKNRFTAV